MAYETQSKFDVARAAETNYGDAKSAQTAAQKFHVVWTNIDVSWRDSSDISGSRDLMPEVELRHDASWSDPEDQRQRARRHGRLFPPRGGNSNANTEATIDQTAVVEPRAAEKLEEASNNEEVLGHKAEMHLLGKCIPCHYVSTRRSCKKAKSCHFCHEPHEGQAKSRPRRAKRLYCKRAADQLSKYEADPVKLMEEVQNLLQQEAGPYMISVVKSKLMRMEKADVEITPELRALIAESEALARSSLAGGEEEGNESVDDEDKAELPTQLQGALREAREQFGIQRRAQAALEPPAAEAKTDKPSGLQEALREAREQFDATLRPAPTVKELQIQSDEAPGHPRHVRRQGILSL